MNIFKSSFPNLSDQQLLQLNSLTKLYEFWNNKINVISRKDISELKIRHILHSLSIAKVIEFKTGSKILDVGTGGGFPGIPLAIMFPKTEFFLSDSIEKKIKVVKSIINELNLKNVRAQKIRSEEIDKKFDFVVCRAVTNMTDFVKIVDGKISSINNHEFKNGIFYLKGGDLSWELKNFKSSIVFDINNFFHYPFFDTKKIVYLPIPYKGKDNQ
ncbi:MAG: 16S rRNA (guanine(527)-N(7))-methyltransferase RsmG [Flavobacteriaceae bacterium]